MNKGTSPGGRRHLQPSSGAIPNFYPSFGHSAQTAFGRALSANSRASNSTSPNPPTSNIGNRAHTPTEGHGGGSTFGNDPSLNSGNSNNSSNNSKRHRVSRACDACRRKKVKCDAQHPRCNNCVALDLECTYLDAAKKRGPPKGYIETIENKLKQLKLLITELAKNDAKSADLMAQLAEQLDREKNSANTRMDSAASNNKDVLTSTPGIGVSFIKLLDEMNVREISERYRAQGGGAGNSSNNNKKDDNGVDDDDDADEKSSNEGRRNSTAPGVMARPHDDEDSDNAYSHSWTDRESGHLTVDETGSMRYLGDASGLFMFTQNMPSSPNDPRLKQSRGLAKHWPPIGRRKTSTNSLKNFVASQQQQTQKSPCSQSPPSRQSPPSSGAGGNGYGNKLTVPSTSSSLIQHNHGSQSPIIIRRKSSAFGIDANGIPRQMPLPGKIPMPSPEEAGRLLRIYFRFIHPFLPLFNRNTLISRTLCRSAPLSPALMSAIYAAASLYDRNSDGSNALSIKIHFQRARSYIEDDPLPTQLTSIHALLLMAVYGQGTMSTTAWMYTGMAIRKAYDLGLHRDPTRWASTSVSGTQIMTEAERAARTRTWWGCFIVDRLISAAMGRPTMIHDFTFDTMYPVGYGDIDDEFMIDRAPIHMIAQDKNSLDALLNKPIDEKAKQKYTPLPRLNLLQDRLQVDSNIAMNGNVSTIDFDADDLHEDLAATTTYSNGKKRLSYGIYYLQLLHILGHVINDIYKSIPPKEYYKVYCTEKIPNRIDTLVYLDNSLRIWRNSLPEELRYSIEDVVKEKLPRCGFVLNISLIYHVTTILLHRPFIPRSNVDSSGLSVPSSLHHDNDPATCATKGISENISESEDHSMIESPIGIRGMESPSSINSLPGSTSSSTQTHSASPYDSHGICTVSAQFISMALSLVTTETTKDIMPFTTFYQLTAGSFHLNNVITGSQGWVARFYLNKTVKMIEKYREKWGQARGALALLDELIETHRIDLAEVSQDTETIYGITLDMAERVDKQAREYNASKIHHKRTHSRTSRTTVGSKLFGSKRTISQDLEANMMAKPRLFSPSSGNQARVSNDESYLSPEPKRVKTESFGLGIESSTPGATTYEDVSRQKENLGARAATSPTSKISQISSSPVRKQQHILSIQSQEQQSHQSTIAHEISLKTGETLPQILSAPLSGTMIPSLDLFGKQHQGYPGSNSSTAGIPENLVAPGGNATNIPSLSSAAATATALPMADSQAQRSGVYQQTGQQPQIQITPAEDMTANGGGSHQQLSAPSLPSQVFASQNIPARFGPVLDGNIQAYLAQQEFDSGIGLEDPSTDEVLVNMALDPNAFNTISAADLSQFDYLPEYLFGNMAGTADNTVPNNAGAGVTAPNTSAYLAGDQFSRQPATGGMQYGENKAMPTNVPANIPSCTGITNYTISSTTSGTTIQGQMIPSNSNNNIGASPGAPNQVNLDPGNAGPSPQNDNNATPLSMQEIQWGSYMDQVMRMFGHA
ncbi:hypothetical protein H4219_002641 [Mycoemilia scoparia]|uniref:Zn(2)-C6 fungal-type domain-containing protein n=1 Tax=Mycoemilia scoparia TaxID=417184 RepID=A0A9W8A202_9FUNG|nr:hypothetical protein H4219_002641 [Mycoemilia scoparia]